MVSGTNCRPPLVVPTIWGRYHLKKMNFMDEPKIPKRSSIWWMNLSDESAKCQMPRLMVLYIFLVDPAYHVDHDLDFDLKQNPLSNRSLKSSFLGHIGTPNFKNFFNHGEEVNDKIKAI